MTQETGVDMTESELLEYLFSLCKAHEYIDDKRLYVIRQFIAQFDVRYTRKCNQSNSDGEISVTCGKVTPVHSLYCYAHTSHLPGVDPKRPPGGQRL